MDNLYYVVDKQGKIVPFKLNVYQKYFLQNRKNRDIILKSRQLWFTTLCVVDAFDEMCFTKNFYAMFIAHQKKEADQILDNKIPVLWDNFKIKQFVSYEVLHEKGWEFRIGFWEWDAVFSFIRAGTSWVSWTYRYQHISELWPMEKEDKGRSDEVLRGLQSVPYDGRVVIESTARGASGSFYDMFMSAWDRKKSEKKSLVTEFEPHFYPWMYDPEIALVKNTIPLNQMKDSQFFIERKEKYKLTEQQINWWYSKFASMRYDRNLLLTEYPMTVTDAFRASGNQYFNQELLDMHSVRDPFQVVWPWKFYSRYDATHVYTLGADSAWGKWWDNATIIVLDITNGNIAAEFCDKFTPPSVLWDEIDKIGRLYGNCLVWPELNNHGAAVIERLKHLNYPNIYRQVKDSTYNDQFTEDLWFLTTAKTKPAILSNLSLAINTFALRINSETVKAELSVYPREASDIIHSDDETWHFDRIIALAIAWEMRKYVNTNRVLKTS